MFNLIVQGAGWESSRDTFPASRVFEYTEEEIKERFKPQGAIDIASVIALPTIFMEEGTSNELAYVGTINRLRKSGSNYQLDYQYDPTIPPIPNVDILKLSDDLGIEEFEFTRTHWAIKSTNFYEALYRLKVGAAVRPRVFNLPDAPIEKDLVSVMMPFAAEFSTVYDAIGAACTEVSCRCERADDIWLNDAIIEDVVHLIATSNVVVADLTGRNANVFYEVGVAHTLGKDVILIAQSNDDVPFDLRHLRYIHYLNNNEGREKLSSKLAKRLQKLIG